MDFEVVITPNAQEKMEQFILYLLLQKRNEQAAGNVLDDFEETKSILARSASAIKLCDDEDLRNRGYRRINFQHHNYFMLYRIEGSTVVVDDIFHELQDYKNWMR